MKSTFKRFSLICILFISSISCVGWGLNPGEMIDIIQKNSISATLKLLFPVNVAHGNIYLMVEVPKNFKKLENPINDLIEFVPSRDKSPYAWSEIITIRSFLGKHLKANEIVKSISKELERTVQNVSVLEENYSSHGKYEEGYALIIYSNKSRRELLRIYAASGPYDSVNVQYAIHVKDDKSFKNDRKRLNNFFKKNVRISNGFK
jgi:hypothetical protein